MQRFGIQRVNGSKTMPRSVRNQFLLTLLLIWERRSMKRLLLVRSDLLRQFLTH